MLIIDNSDVILIIMACHLKESIKTKIPLNFFHAKKSLSGSRQYMSLFLLIMQIRIPIVLNWYTFPVMLATLNWFRWFLLVELTDERKSSYCLIRVILAVSLIRYHLYNWGAGKTETSNVLISLVRHNHHHHQNGNLHFWVIDVLWGQNLDDHSSWP